MRYRAQKSLSCILLSAAVAVGFSSGAQGAPLKKVQVPAVQDLQIPPANGRLVESFQSPRKNAPLVVHIQDLHVHYEAQTNIGKILEALHKQYGLRLILLEGSAGKLDTAFFADFPDKKVRNEVADFFMKKGQITGPEYLSITGDIPIELYGIEDPDRYKEHLEAFNAYYAQKPPMREALDQAEAVATRLKEKLYSPQLKELEQKARDFDEKKVPFTDYLKYLRALQEKHAVGLDLMPNIALLFELMDREAKINFKALEAENQRLVDELAKKLPKAELEDLVKKSADLKAGKMEQEDYYLIVRDVCQRYKMNTSGYPNLNLYWDYLSVHEKVNSTILFEEIAKLNGRLKLALAASKPEQELVRASEGLDFLDRMIEMKLSKDDWLYYQGHQSEYAEEAVLKPLKTYAKKIGLGDQAKKLSLQPITRNQDKLERFYELAVERDAALFQNVLREMEETKQNFSVVVTGGFHTKGLTTRLREKGISYVVVSPKITQKVDDTLYLEILSGKRTPMDEVMEEEGVQEGVEEEPIEQGKD